MLSAMRILYGVVGEGMGHAMRSRVVIDELRRRHDLQVVVSGRAYEYLRSRIAGAGPGTLPAAVDRIWGYTLVYEDNEVSRFKTAVQNLKGAVTGWPHNIRTYVEIAERFQPEVVISDFETWSFLFAQRHALPVISVDNMQIINRCKHPPEVLAGLKDFELTRAIVKAKVPGAFHYHVTTFFYPPVRKERTTLHPPILRPEILAARPEPGEHLLVYTTTGLADPALAEVLRRSGRECRIYGMRRDLSNELVEGPLRYRPFSEAGFIDDLRTARGVIASAGFTLMGEAVYLRRPMLAVPVAGQIEQVLNARYLEREGYGMAAEAVDDARLGAFLERLPDCERRLAGYQQDGNQDLLDALEGTLARATTRP